MVTVSKTHPSGSGTISVGTRGSYLQTVGGPVHRTCFGQGSPALLFPRLLWQGGKTLLREQALEGKVWLSRRQLGGDLSRFGIQKPVATSYEKDNVKVWGYLGKSLRGTTSLYPYVFNNSILCGWTW